MYWQQHLKSCVHQSIKDRSTHSAWAHLVYEASILGEHPLSQHQQDQMQPLAASPESELKKKLSPKLSKLKFKIPGLDRPKCVLSVCA